MSWIYFKYNDLLHMLNVYKIPWKKKTPGSSFLSHWWSISFLRYKTNVGKTSYSAIKAQWLLMLGKFFFLENPNFMKVNLPKHVRLRKSHWLLLIKLHWSCFKYNDLLHRLIVYQIPKKEH